MASSTREPLQLLIDTNVVLGLFPSREPWYTQARQLW